MDIFMSKTKVFCGSMLVVGFFLAVSGVAEADPLMFFPFAKEGQFACPQGNNGTYTHKDTLRYAFDFNKGPGANSKSNPMYGQSVYSPARGTVTRVVNDIEDFKVNGSGFGNMLTIKDAATGKVVRIAHLQKGSITLKVGDSVEVGTFVGKAGQSGFSTGPHTHIQLQEGDYGSSLPFKFVEGPLKCGTTQMTASLLTPKASVLDNTSETSVGNMFGAATTSISGTWQQIYTGQGFNGSSYTIHTVGTNDSAKFTWSFSVKENGYYNVMVNLPGLNPGRDSKAKYTFLGAEKYIDQRYNDGIGADNWVTIKYAAKLQAYTTYTVVLQGTTVGKTIAADTLVVSKQ